MSATPGAEAAKDPLLRAFAACQARHAVEPSQSGSWERAWRAEDTHTHNTQREPCHFDSLARVGARSTNGNGERERGSLQSMLLDRWSVAEAPRVVPSSHPIHEGPRFALVPRGKAAGRSIAKGRQGSRYCLSVDTEVRGEMILEVPFECCRALENGLYLGAWLTCCLTISVVKPRRCDGIDWGYAIPSAERHKTKAT